MGTDLHISLSDYEERSGVERRVGELTAHLYGSSLPRQFVHTTGIGPDVPRTPHRTAHRTMTPYRPIYPAPAPLIVQHRTRTLYGPIDPPPPGLPPSTLTVQCIRRVARLGA